MNYSETLSLIEETWGLDELHVIRELQNKGDRTTLALEDKANQYVVKLFGPSKSEDTIANDTNVLTYLNKARYEYAPKLIYTNDGRRYTCLGDKLVYIMERIPGNTPTRSPETYTRLGVATSRLHTLKGWTSPCSLNLELDLEDAVKNAVDSGYSFANDLRSLVSWLPDYNTFPQGLIHTDIGAHNAIQKPDGQVILIDWDDAGVGCLAIDSGYPLICDFVELSTGQPTFRYDLAEAFYSSYFEGAPTIDKETLLIGVLFFAITYLKFGNPELCWSGIKWSLENIRSMSFWTKLGV